MSANNPLYALGAPDRIHPMPGQMLAHVKHFSPSAEGAPAEKPRVVTELDQANLITSRTTSSALAAFGGHHKPVIDIDMPVKVIPSSTPGHCHLYIDRTLRWDQYVELLKVLAKVGILESGYVDASLQRGYTAVRLPWVRKETPAPAPAGQPSTSGAPAHKLLGVPGGSSVPCRCQVGHDHGIEELSFCTCGLDKPCECSSGASRP